jgi:L-2-amino-thiazoline-4-carboxylic acid hydrolase-like protein
MTNTIAINTTAAPHPNLLDRLFLWTFERRLRKALRCRGATVAVALAREASARRTMLVEENRDRIVDRASESHLWLCAAVTAAYHVLRSHATTRDAALSIVREVFLSTGAKGVGRAMRLLPKLVRDPFKFTINISKKKQSAYYGRTFERVVVQDDNDAYRMTVSKCFYHRFLIDNGAAELGPTFCDKDLDWAAAIDPVTHGFSFNRPTTLLTTGEPCRFEFRRTRPTPSRAMPDDRAADADP